MRRGKLQCVYATLLLIGSAALAAPTELPLVGRVEQLEKQLANKGLIELLQQIELLKLEVRGLRGALEDQSYALEQVRTSHRDSYADTDRRLTALEQGTGAAPAVGAIGPPLDPPLSTSLPPVGSTIAGPPSDQVIAVDMQTPTPAIPAPPQAVVVDPGQPPAATVIAAVPPGQPTLPPSDPAAASASVVIPGANPLASADSADSEAAYRSAFELLKAGQYEQSINAFNAYLKQYPSSQYNDNAQYWIAESYFVLGQFEPALAEYQKLIANYPASQKLPNAMIKIADSYARLGFNDRAASTLTQVKQLYPDSAVARIADEQLLRVRAATP